MPSCWATLGSPIVMRKIGGDAEEPRTGVCSIEVVRLSRAKRSGERLTDEIFGVISAHTFDDVPVQWHCMSVKENGETVGI